MLDLFFLIMCYTTDIVPCSCLNEICDISSIFNTQIVEKTECFLINIRVNFI